ncbi:transposase [Gloeobacter morelensis MG652769]|uniref:Transposase n=2 Tax=Gloeobacter TaxID=33071 RepID=A0ABY3PUC7_9CYAN|nr:transposase [Gloeobacter morelensis MG652769]
MMSSSLSLKLPFMRLNESKRREFARMERLNTDVANQLLRQPRSERSTLTSKDFSHIELGSAWINQTIRNANARTGVKRFKRLPLETNNQNWTLHKVGDTYSVSFALLRGRVKRIPLEVHQSKYGSLLEGLLSGAVRRGTLKLWQSRRGIWYVVIGISMEVPEVQPIQNWIGVDRGQNHLAVASLPGGMARFWTFGWVKQVRRHYANKRSKLAKAGKHNTIRRLGNKEQRIIRHINHIISRQIVQMARDFGCGLRLEDLSGIQGRIGQRSRGRSDPGKNRTFWPYLQLEYCLLYKARLAGVPVEKVPAYFTSATCCKCGALGERCRHRFVCQRCGLQGQSDWVASQNIGNWVGLACPIGLQKAELVMSSAVRSVGAYGTPPSRVSEPGSPGSRE